MSLLLLMRRQRTYASKVRGIAPANLVSYLPLWEASGSVAADTSGHGYNGAYVGVDLGQPGIGDGRTCPLYDGVNDCCNWYSASLNTAMNKSEGSLALWVKVAAGVWTDATLRTIVRLRADASNSVDLQRTGANNTVLAAYAAGGALKSVSSSALAGTANWFHMALTWSSAANEMKVYLNGAQVGTTQTGLGTWSGALSSTNACIGASTTAPIQVFGGNLAHVVLYSTPLSAAQIAQLASLT